MSVGLGRKNRCFRLRILLRCYTWNGHRKLVRPENEGLEYGVIPRGNFMKTELWRKGKIRGDGEAAE